MMSSFDYPSNSVLVDKDGNATTPWAQLFSRWQSIITAVPQSGTTAKRPTTGLWIGRQYWDVTLQKPVYVASVRPSVWKDAAGVIV